MSLGHQFLQAALRDSTPALLRQAGAVLFQPDELPVYDFIRSHYMAYQVLPDEAALRSAGFQLPQLRSTQPAAYFLTRLRQRFIYNTITGNMSGLTTAIETQDTDAAVEVLRQTLSTIGASAGGHTATLIGDEMEGVEADFEEARTTWGLRGITMGWETLDTCTLGAMPGDLIVIAGRPGMGKTYALLEMAYAAWRRSHRLLFLSMEMGKRQIATRWVGRHTGINPRLIRAGELSPWGRQILHDGFGEIRNATGKLYIENGMRSRTVGAIEAMVLQFNPEAVYVDAAYLLSPEGRKKGFVSKWEGLAEVIADLKAMAVNHNIPVFITVQFNRNQRSGRSSRLDHLRKMTLLKNREGEGCRLLYRYQFAPVSFEEVPWDASYDEGDDPDLGDIAGTDSIPQDASLVLGIQKPKLLSQDGQTADAEEPEGPVAAGWTV